MPRIRVARRGGRGSKVQAGAEPSDSQGNTWLDSTRLTEVLENLSVLQKSDTRGSKRQKLSPDGDFVTPDDGESQVFPAEFIPICHESFQMDFNQDEQISAIFEQKLKHVTEFKISSKSMAVSVVPSTFRLQNSSYDVYFSKADSSSKGAFCRFMYDRNHTQDPIMNFVLAIQNRKAREHQQQAVCSWSLVVAKDNNTKDWQMHASVDIAWQSRTYADPNLEAWGPLLLEYALFNPNKGKNETLIKHLRQGKRHEIVPRDFYEACYVPPAAELVSDIVQVSELTTRLFPFQKRTVKWLLQREHMTIEEGEIVDSGTNPSLDFFEEVTIEGYGDYSVNIPSGLLCKTQELQQDRTSPIIRGGILAEEMGLGKSVELISLISLHRRQMEMEPATLHDYYSEREVRPSPATLIISPTSILQQWMNELERHAPDLRVFHYQGTQQLVRDIHKRKGKGKGKSESSEESNAYHIALQGVQNQELVDHILQYDIVLTSYPILGAEIHYADEGPQRSMRNPRKYERRSCPLLDVSWWRVCLDEAQMVETGVSHPAQVARMLPRVNAWAVTGTPVHRKIEDLYGLLLFLRVPLWGYRKTLWDQLLLNKSFFKGLFNNIAVRHTRDMIRDEIKLPLQKRVVISVPFSQIEDANYQRLFSDACFVCGVNEDGSPARDDWDPDREDVRQNMRIWLGRLRQTCVHPQVGARNKKALGGQGDVLRTVDEVLDIMIAQNDSTIKVDERNMFVLIAKRAQIDLEGNEDAIKAIRVLPSALDHAHKGLEAIRQELSKHLEDKGSRVEAVQGTDSATHDQEESVAEEDIQDKDLIKVIDDTADMKLSTYRNRLRDFVEVEHKFTFILGNAQFVLKEQLQEHGDDDKVQDAEKKETEYYEKAKILRRELMSETESTAQQYMTNIEKRASKQLFTVILGAEAPDFYGGIETNTILRKLESLTDALNVQAEILDDWREKMIAVLQRPLIDQNSEDVELEGDEMIADAQAQEEGFLYIDALRLVIADRIEAVTGIQNMNLQKDDFAYEEYRNMQREAREQQLYATLTATREKCRPVNNELGNFDDAIKNSLKGLVTTLRGIITRLKGENGARARSESAIAQELLKHMQKTLLEQDKINKSLEREIAYFNAAFNARLAYYRQLQTISDDLGHLDLNEEMKAVKAENIEELITACTNKEKVLRDKISTAKAKGRYLEHLKLAPGETQEMCIICRETFDIGCLTVCGHQFCRDCMNAWYAHHKSCPMCKKTLKRVDMYPISYKKEDITIQEELHPEELAEVSSHPTSNEPAIDATIYSSINTNILDQINQFDVSRSFGSKIDMIVKTLLFLQVADKGAKSIIFSQWSDVITAVHRALEQNKIKHTSLSEPNAVKNFKTNPEIGVFLLHAKTQSAGLTLVEASHVFLCEPLVNTGLELQAIARIHRIGQTRETKVWLFLISNTVEESVHALSTRKRLEVMGLVKNGGRNDNKKKNRKGKGKQRQGALGVEEEEIEQLLETANSNELLKASASMIEKGASGGEVVDDESLWKCLFGVTRRNRTEADIEARRHLAASAAENRVITGRSRNP